MLFRQWLAFGLRQERQHEEADQEDEAHGHAGIAEALNGIIRELLKIALQGRFHQRAQSGGEAADIVAKAGSGRAQSRREQFREIDRIAAKERKLAESHDGDHDEYLPK